MEYINNFRGNHPDATPFSGIALDKLARSPYLYTSVFQETEVKTFSDAIDTITSLKPERVNTWADVAKTSLLAVGRLVASLFALTIAAPFGTVFHLGYAVYLAVQNLILHKDEADIQWKDRAVEHLQASAKDFQAAVTLLFLTQTWCLALFNPFAIAFAATPFRTASYFLEDLTREEGSERKMCPSRTSTQLYGDLLTKFGLRVTEPEKDVPVSALLRLQGEVHEKACAAGV